MSAETSEEFAALSMDAFARSPDFVALFNFHDAYPAFKDGGYIFMQEFFSCLAINIMIDHPLHLRDKIIHFEDANSHDRHRQAPAPPGIYGIMEPEHAVFLNDLGIADSRIFPFPQAGPPPSATIAPFEQRDIDILFHGTIGELLPDDVFFGRIGSFGSLRQATKAAIDAVLNLEGDVYLIARRELAARDLPFDAGLMAEQVDRRVRTLRRHHLLSTFSGRQIHFCGTVCDSFKRANPNGIYHGELSFTEVAALSRRAKVVLNDSINLRHALLMRAHYAMAEGCVLASERNPTIETQFTDMKDVLILDGTAEDNERLSAVVGDRRLWSDISGRGIESHVRSHQWDHRVGALMAAAGIAG
ncbi:MAG: glycosyltransferase family 1 protein [Magnetospirillum sp.]|nr:glycosyltransferase family 1 protein [Magnetospirillum sp.]